MAQAVPIEARWLCRHMEVATIIVSDEEREGSQSKGSGADTPAGNPERERPRQKESKHVAKRRHGDVRRKTRRARKRRKRSRKPRSRSEEKERRSRGHAEGARSAARRGTERLEELDELLAKVIEGTDIPRRKLPINRSGERPRSQEEQQRREYEKYLWRRLAGHLPMYHELVENRREAAETAVAGERLRTIAKMARDGAQEAAAAGIYRDVWGQEITAQWIEVWKLFQGVGVRVEGPLRGEGLEGRGMGRRGARRN